MPAEIGHFWAKLPYSHHAPSYSHHKGETPSSSSWRISSLFPQPPCCVKTFFFKKYIYIFFCVLHLPALRSISGHLWLKVDTTQCCHPSALHGRWVASGACTGTAAPQVMVGDRSVPDPWLGWSQRCEVIGRCLFVLSMNTELFSPRWSLLCKAKS